MQRYRSGVLRIATDRIYTENCYRPNLNGVNAAVVLATTCDPFLRVVKAKPNPRQRQHAEEKLEEKSAVIYIMI